MRHFTSTLSPLGLAIFTLALVAACSGDMGGGQAKEELLTAQQVAPNPAEAPRLTQQTASSSLLDSLALEYPNGQLPTDRTAQAAKALSQNPSVFKKSTSITAQSGVSSQNIQPQAFTLADFKPVYRIQNTTLPGSYFFTIYEFEKTAALAANPNWKLEGPAFYTLPAASTDLSPVYRFRNKVNGSYLYTAYESEKIDIETNYADAYALEGVAWRAQQTPAPGFTALFRFRNKTNGTYLNTSYEAERDAILRDFAAIFELEGTAYYVQNSLPIEPTCTPAVDGTSGYALVFKACNGAVAEYYDKTECVRENATGLIWEGKTTDGLRAMSIKYSNWDDVTKKQVIRYTSIGPGQPSQRNFYQPTQAEIGSDSNTKGYQKAVNATGLCGFADWRRPSPSELLALVKPGAAPQIDTTWFPNTYNGDYWTGAIFTNASGVENEALATTVRFDTGVKVYQVRNSAASNAIGVTFPSAYIRLVR